MELRLDKILSGAGAATRSESRLLIKRGAVLIDGRPALGGDQKVDPKLSVIEVNGAAVRWSEHVYIMMNKPAGFVSSTDDPRERTVMELLGGNFANIGLAPAGRLDKDAEGLLILTNDGDFAHRVISPSSKVKKVYYVETVSPTRAEDAAAFSDGLILRDGQKCLPAELRILGREDRNAALVTLEEGKYHQVKRMVASRGNRVSYLRRVAVGGLRLDKRLGPGDWKELTSEEIDAIFTQKNDDFSSIET